MIKRILIFFTFLSLPLMAFAVPGEQPRDNTWRSLGLDERLTNGEDLVPNRVAFGAITALLVPGTPLPNGLSEADARIILRSALKSGALDKDGRFGSDLMKAMKIKGLVKDFLTHERVEARSPMALISAVRSESFDFIYAFILLARVARLDIVTDAVFEKLEQKAREGLLLIGTDLINTNVTPEERKEFLFHLLGFCMTSALGLDLEQPRQITDTERKTLEEFLGQFDNEEELASDVQAQVKANRRSGWRTAAMVTLWVTAGVVAFTYWRYSNSLVSYGMNPALMHSLEGPMLPQVLLTAVPAIFTGWVGYLAHRDRDRLRHLVQRKSGRLSSMGVKVSGLLAGTRDFCSGFLSKFKPGQPQGETEDVMDMLREAMFPQSQE